MNAIQFVLDHPVQSALLSGDILATIAVGWGILWEAPEQTPERHRIAKWLVIGGVFAETVCSISLFAYDESISQEQQSKILALETRLAPRFLTARSQQEIADELVKFRGQQFQGVVAPDTPDGRSIWDTLYRTLIAAKWQFVSPSSMGMGNPPAAVPIAPEPDIVIFIPASAEVSVYSAAHELAKLLVARGIAAKAIAGTLGDNSRNPALIAISIGIKTE